MALAGDRSPPGRRPSEKAAAMALADYISNNFAQLKTQLAWDSGTLNTIVARTLESYPAATEGAASDSVKLHALADVATWRQALNDVSLDYNFSADGASYSRGQMADAIRKNLADAEARTIVYTPAYQMIVHPDDPNPDWFE